MFSGRRAEIILLKWKLCRVKLSGLARGKGMGRLASVKKA